MSPRPSIEKGRAAIPVGNSSCSTGRHSSVRKEQTDEHACPVRLSYRTAFSLVNISCFSSSQHIQLANGFSFSQYPLFADGRFFFQHLLLANRFLQSRYPGCERSSLKKFLNEEFKSHGYFDHKYFCIPFPRGRHSLIEATSHYCAIWHPGKATVLSRMRDTTPHLDRGVERFCNADHYGGAEHPEDVVDEQAALKQGVKRQTGQPSASSKPRLFSAADSDTCFYCCSKTTHLPTLFQHNPISCPPPYWAVPWSA
jgi:hypothetical protein